MDLNNKKLHIPTVKLGTYPAKKRKTQYIHIDTKNHFTVATLEFKYTHKKTRAK